MNVDDRSPDSTSELTTAVALPDALATYEDEVAAMIDGGVKKKDAATEPPSKKIPVGKSTIGKAGKAVGKAIAVGKGVYVAKKPSAHVSVPKASTIVSFAKTNPPPYGTALPCSFNGCKIDGSSTRYRVVPFPGKSVYDYSVPSVGDAQKAWGKVIEYCKNPKIPEHSINSF